MILPGQDQGGAHGSPWDALLPGSLVSLFSFFPLLKLNIPSVRWHIILKDNIVLLAGVKSKEKWHWYCSLKAGTALVEFSLDFRRHYSSTTYFLYYNITFLIIFNNP